MTDKDRIRLAEAMFETEENSLVIGKNRELMWLTDAEGKAIVETIRPIPNPFTDANDDYAVLEWMLGRVKTSYQYRRVAEELYQINRHSVAGYKVGNYAIAALKVIDND